MAKQNIQSYKIIIIAKDVVCISFRQMKLCRFKIRKNKGNQYNTTKQEYVSKIIFTFGGESVSSVYFFNSRFWGLNPDFRLVDDVGLGVLGTAKTWSALDVDVATLLPELPEGFKPSASVSSALRLFLLRLSKISCQL